MKWYLKVFKNYAEFNGRARRTEYWMFLLFNFIFGFAASIFDGLSGLTYGKYNMGVLYIIYTLVLLIPSLAVLVRRLHDTNRSGWWILISLIPIVGWIWIFVLLVLDSDPNENEYGPNPKLNETI